MSIEFAKQELIQHYSIILDRMESGDLTGQEFNKTEKQLEQILAKMKELQSEVKK